jgi:hypothetical protein
MTDDNASPTIDINYIKSELYREVSCDGMMGGPTPSEKIWLGFYSERLPVPRVVRHGLMPGAAEGQWSLDPTSEPVVVEGKSGLIRNLEVGLYMSIDTAEQLRDWLVENLEKFKEATK